MQSTPLGSIDEQGHLQVVENLTRQQLQPQSFQPLGRLPAAIQVNLVQVKSCDSIGIAALVWLLRQAHQQNSTLRWVNIPPAVSHLLALYHLEDEELIADAGRVN